MEQKNREKLIINIGIIAAVIIIFVAAFVFPTLDSIKRQKSIKRNQLKNMAKLKDLLEQAPASGTETTKKFEGSLSAFVEQTASQSDITIAYIRPFDQDQGVEVKVEDLEGDKLLQFIYVLEENGVAIQRLNLRDYKGNGIWIVKMFLRGGGDSGQNNSTKEINSEER